MSIQISDDHLDRIINDGTYNNWILVAMATELKELRAQVAELERRLAVPVVLRGGSLKPDGKFWYNENTVRQMIRDAGYPVEDNPDPLLKRCAAAPSPSAENE